MARIIIPVLCIALTALGLYNVYGDASAVEAMAEQVACGADSCSVTKLGVSRTPISHTYVFQTSLKGQRTAEVSCQRELVFFGDYHCEPKR